MTSKSSLYPNGSVFTVDIGDNKLGQPRIPSACRDPNHASFDVAVLVDSKGAHTAGRA